MILLLSLVFQGLVAMGAEAPSAAAFPSALAFYSGPIRVCGGSIGSNRLLKGLTDREAQCLDEVVPVSWPQWKSAAGERVGLSAEGSWSLERGELLAWLKRGRSECLDKHEIFIPERLSFIEEKVWIEELFLDWVQDQLQQKLGSSGERFEIQRIRWPHSDCAAETTHQLSEFGVDGAQQFHFTLTLNQKASVIHGSFRRFLRLPVAARFLSVGRVLEMADITFKEVDVSFKGDYLSSQERVVGNILQTPLNQGDVFRPRDLKAIPLVERGQMIQITYQGPQFELRAAGLAEQSGVLGQWIKVKNLESQKLISGVVIEKGIVEVQ